MELPSKQTVAMLYSLCLIAIGTATALISYGKIEPQTFENVVVWTIGIFSLGSVGDSGLKTWLESLIALKRERMIAEVNILAQTKNSQ